MNNTTAGLRADVAQLLRILTAHVTAGRCPDAERIAEAVTLTASLYRRLDHEVRS